MALQLKELRMMGLGKAAPPPSSRTEKLCDLRQVIESLSLFAPL